MSGDWLKDLAEWQAAGSVPRKARNPKRVREVTVPLPVLTIDEQVLTLRRRVAALERMVDNLNAQLEDQHRGADRDFHEFMDRVGWTERLDLLS